MKYTLFSILLVLMAFHVVGCQEKAKQQPPVFECKLVSSFDEYPDSTFFKDVFRVDAMGGRLYMLDQWRGDVAVLDMKTDSFYTVGAKGQGPKELAQASDFYVQDDTLAILDGAALSLKLFYGKEYVRSLNVPSGKELRFFMDGEKVYLPCLDKETVYIKLPKAWQRDQLKDVELAGEYLDITDEEGMNFSRNERHLVKGEGCLYAVCPSHPVVQKYDLHTHALLASYDLSEIEFVRKSLSIIQAKSSGGNSYPLYLRDACFRDGCLYLLCADWLDGYSQNTLIALDADLHPSALYRLPGEYYSAFSVDGRTVYAMNYKDCVMEILAMP